VKQGSKTCSFLLIVQLKDALTLIENARIDQVTGQ